MKSYKKYLIALFIIALGIGLFYNKVYIPKSTYKTIKPIIGDLKVTIKGIGNVSALNIYSITAQTGGRILDILVDDGDWVKKGDLLIVMDGVDMPVQLEITKANLRKSNFDILASKAELKNLYAQKELLKTTFKRYVELKKQGFASQSEYDKADAELKSINANIVVSASHIKSAKAALVVAYKNIDAIKVRIDRLNVYSPVDGQIISRYAEVAQNVLPSTPILKIVDPKTLLVKTKIDERISAQIKENQKATISLRSQENKTYEGRVERIMSTSDPVTLEREIYITFDTTPKPFYINEQAQVDITVKKLTSVLKIPSNIVFQKNGKLGVWLKKNDHAKFLEIKIIAQNDNEIAVSNISKESLIIVPESSKKSLNDGMKVH